MKSPWRKAVKFFGEKIQSSPFSAISLYTGREIVYGLRPQHIQVLTDSSETHSHTIEAELILSETTGTETQFSLIMADIN